MKTATLPAGTTREQWERYYEDVKAHEAYCERLRPKRTDFADDASFDTATSKWHMMLHCDAPNEPGYFRANND